MKQIIPYLGLVALLGLLACSRGGSAVAEASNPKPSTSEQLATAKRAVLDFTTCDGGLTVEKATLASVHASGAQQVEGISYVGSDGADNDKYAIKYKAANGSHQEIVFGYHPSSGDVRAENDAALAVLRLMKAGC